MSVDTKQSLNSLIKQVQHETGLLNLKVIVKEVLARLTPDEQADALVVTLTSYASTVLSDGSLSTTKNSFLPTSLDPESMSPPSQEGSTSHLTIKQPGKQWITSWDNEYLADPLRPGHMVAWPDYTLEMAQMKGDLLTKRSETNAKNAAKQYLIRDTFAANKVTRVGDLPPAARKIMETTLGGIPRD